VAHRRTAPLQCARCSIGTFIIPTTKSKVLKTRDGTDVAARYFVYKLYEGTDGQPMQWATLHGLGESAATISRVVERGWVILQDAKAKPLERKAALTDEGRRMALLIRDPGALSVQQPGFAGFTSLGSRPVPPVAATTVQVSRLLAAWRSGH
jgi:hypothetical protein